MICEITGTQGKCVSYNIVPLEDRKNLAEKILGRPLKEYEPFILTISQDVYKARHRGTIQKKFVRKVYEKHGKEETIKLINVLDILKVNAGMIRYFAFTILIKKHALYMAAPTEKSVLKANLLRRLNTVQKKQYNQHLRRLAVLIAFKKRHNLTFNQLSEITGKPHINNYFYTPKVTGFGSTFCSDENWLPIKQKLQEYEEEL